MPSREGPPAPAWWPSRRSAGRVPGPSSRPGSALSYATTYYPGTLDPNDATPIALLPGEERRGVDFVVTAVATATVAGTVMGSNGSPAANARVSLTPLPSGSTSAQPVGVATPVRVIEADGRFSFPTVLPGRYVLAARVSSPEASASTGRGVGPASALDLWARTTTSSLSLASRRSTTSTSASLNSSCQVPWTSRLPKGKRRSRT